MFFYIICYTEYFSLRDYSGFLQIGSHIYVCTYMYKYKITYICMYVLCNPDVVGFLVNSGGKQNSIINDDGSCVDIQLGSTICLKVSTGYCAGFIVYALSCNTVQLTSNVAREGPRLALVSCMTHSSKLVACIPLTYYAFLLEHQSSRLAIVRTLSSTHECNMWL